MPEEVKFTDDEIKEVRQIQKNYTTIQNRFGQLKLAQIRLENQEIQLEESLKQIQDTEEKFLDGITDKYGQGTLNPETGVFTPTSETTENKSE